MQHMGKTAFPFITIAMPVRNEEKFIRDTLNEILEQDYPKNRYEIIVADGESTDSTPEIVREISRLHPQVILMSNPGLLPSSGRNIGFKNGRGELFLVIDGHCKIENRHLLQNLVECFEKSGAHCMGRPQPFIVPVEPTMQKAIALARISKLGHSSDSLIHSNEEGFVSPISVGCSYKREVFQEIDFVDESFDACEDVEFNYRVEKAGFKTYFSPKLAVFYYPRETLSGLYRQLVRYGKGRAKFIFKHPETISLNMFIPVVFLGGMLLGPLLGAASRPLMLLYLTGITIYFTIISFEAMRIRTKEDLFFIIKLIAVFFVIHASLGIGIISGCYNELIKSNQHL